MFREILHYFGVGLLAVGSAILIYWVYNNTLEPALPKTPFPLASPIEVIYITPTPNK